MFSFLSRLFDTTDFPRRWDCGNWDAGHGWLHIVADLGVWSAYLAISVALLAFARRRRDVPFRHLFWLFGAFILLCGATHLMEAVNFWWPAYRLAAVVKIATAVVSWATLMTLLRVIPRALAIRSAEEVARKGAEARLRDEARLRASDERFQAVVESALDAIVTTDQVGTVIGWNRGAEQTFGYPAAEAVGRNVTLIIPDRFRTAHTKGMGAYRMGQPSPVLGRVVEVVGVRKGGAEFPVELSVGVWKGGEHTFFTSIMRDVTERKRAEEDARENVERFRAAFDRTGVGSALVGRDGRFLKVNPALCRALGYPEAELLATTFQDLTHPDDLAADLAHLDRLAAGEVTTYSMDKRYIHKDGSVVWGHLSVSAVPDSVGGVAYYVSQIQDVTERKRAETALRMRDRAIEAIALGVCITDASLPDNPIVYVNRGFETLTGYSAADVVGKNCRLLQGPNTDPAALDVVRTAVRGGVACAVELVNYRKDGTPFYNALSVAPVRDDAGAVVQFIAAQVDTTAFRRLEDQLRQSQKMEAVGHLAGGVAHDFNNLLTVINGYTEMLLAGAAPADQVPALLAEVQAAGARAADLTRQLLAFSRKTILQPKVVDLNDLVAGIQRMLARLIGEDVRLATSLRPGIGRVRVDPGQLEQVLVNLAVNARDAMPTGGRLTIETDAADLDEGYARTHPEVRPGRYVLLSMSDTGTGMSDEVKARIFEPFFTTKGVGQGTGLGLATVYGIIKQSGGHLSVYSEVGKGTAFKVYLPVALDAPAATTVFKTPPPRGTETVLLVEDEARVRAMTGIALRGGGYTVLEAGSAEEATRVFAARPEGAVDLLLTDVVMPGASGRVLAERLSAAAPGLKVLYMSGYTDDAVVRHGLLAAEVAFVQKPFALDALLQKVRKVLDARPPRAARPEPARAGMGV